MKSNKTIFKLIYNLIKQVHFYTPALFYPGYRSAHQYRENILWISQNIARTINNDCAKVHYYSYRE